MTENLPYYPRMGRIIDLLQSKGFHKTFVLQNKQFLCLETEETFAPNEMSVYGSYRFEESQGPRAEIFALEAITPQIKGIFIADEAELLNAYWRAAMHDKTSNRLLRW